MASDAPTKHWHGDGPQPEGLKRGNILSGAGKEDHIEKGKLKPNDLDRGKKQNKWVAWGDHYGDLLTHPWVT